MTAADICRDRERFYSKPYLCPAKKWTIGYGHTTGIGPDTPPCTEEQAEIWLQEDLAKAFRVVKMWVGVFLTTNQREALASFVFNVGPGAPNDKDGFVWLKRLRNGTPVHSTMLVKLNAGDYAGAAAEFPKWVYGGGKVLDGLVTRRAMERSLFESEV